MARDFHSPQPPTTAAGQQEVGLGRVQDPAESSTVVGEGWETPGVVMVV
jgi:hypothetical protein